MEYVQELLRIDASTIIFSAVYLTCLAILLVASLAFGGLLPTRAKTRDISNQSTARPKVLQFGIDLGSHLVGMVARTGITPNQITLIGLVLVCFNCVVFAYTKNTFALGSGLIAALLFDTLDGMVARSQGTSSRFGGYLDAIVDRYEEVVIYLTIGMVLGLWLEAYLIITGSMLISYNKARVALETETSNNSWPDLLQKPTRLFILCFGLIGDPIIPWLLELALWLLVVMTYYTSIQRVIRARFLLGD